MPINRDFFKRYPADVWIETGTCNGDGVQSACDANYPKIYSIELDEQLYERAKARFFDNSAVEVYQGSSAIVLPEILLTIKNGERVVFWLDAHYSGGNTAGSNKDHPLLKEIESIGKWKMTNGLLSSAIIFIDDMRTFNKEDVGFSQEDVLKEVLKINKQAMIKRLDGYQGHTGLTFKEDILMAAI